MSKISELSDGGSLLPTDYLIAVRSGGNVKVQADTINVDQIDLGDNEKIRLGNSQDLEIFHNATDSIINDNGTGSLKLQQGGSTKLEVTTTGIDVTGTVTADGLTVDGTTATIQDDSANLRFENSAGTRTGYIQNRADAFEIWNDQATFMSFGTNNTEAMRIDAQGQVRLSNTTPVWDATFSSLVAKGGWVGSQSSDYFYAGGQTYFNAGWKRLNANAASLYEQSFGVHKWYNTISGAADSTISWAQAMTLDASGNLLVGQTTASSGTVGASLRADGRNFFCADGNYSGYFNRNTSDGTIVNFAKDDTTVGSIGAESSGLLIGSGNVGVRFIDSGQDRVIPRKTTLANADAAIDLGDSGSRFKDLYLSGGAYLGGVTSANLLDDYEEGTWTPTNAGATLTVTNARYTKIGRLVNVSCHVVANADTSGDWGGLPFTMDVNGMYSGSVGYQNDTTGETWNVIADAGTSWTMRKGLTSEQLTSGNNMRMSLTYCTTA